MNSSGAQIVLSNKSGALLRFVQSKHGNEKSDYRIATYQANVLLQHEKARYPRCSRAWYMYIIIVYMGR